MDPIETIIHADHAIEIHYDMDAENPRDDDEHRSLFLGFPHRHYSIGDETLNPGDKTFPCPACNATGTILAGTDDEGECARCDGEGEVYTHNLAELIELVGIEHDARMVRAVGMLDHSGVKYYLGGGAHWCDPGGWDSGTCGLLVFPRATLRERGHDDPDAIPDDKIIEWMKGEIETYSCWANGETYGYVIRTLDSDGEPDEEVDSCWGYYGFDDVVSEAKAAAESLVRS